MAMVTFYYLLQLSLLFGLGIAGIVEFCGYDYGAVHRGKLSRENADVYDTKKNMRSKVECAVNCYADEDCRTAVYTVNKDCLFISNFTDQLTFTDSTHSYVANEDVMEMKSRYNARAGATEVMDCPTACTGYSICFMDCTEEGTVDPDDLEAGCMDITTRQYTDDGCGFQPHIQTKEYYMPYLDRSTSGSNYDFFTVTFQKLFDWTTLQVKFRGTLRTAYGWGGPWVRWKIKFNGNDCSNPGYIESINYNSESDTDHYKASGINGICYGLSAGTYSISLRNEVGASSYSRVGYATHATRFFVEELGQGTWTGEPAVHPCPSLSSFNFREHVTTTSWGNEPTVTLWNVGYTKMEADTWVRVNIDLSIRQHSQGHNSVTCATWYVLIDGGHCQPVAYGKTLANLDYANEVNNEHRSSEFEGHCSGISAGYHTFALYLAGCPWGHGYMDVYTGYNSNRNRYIIEEIRAGSNIVAAMAPDGQTLYRIPQFNMVMHGVANIARGDDNAVVWTLPAYHKIYRTSGLRLAMSYDARVYWGHGNSGHYDPCCRHYFRIDGAECANPGTIEGINYLNKRTNIHRPNMIEGVCEGIDQGNRVITVWAGLCRHYGQIGECIFGWNSYVHLMISEAYVERDIVQY